MLQLLWIIPLLPFASFLVLAMFGPRLPRLITAIIGVGSVAASAVMTCLVAASFIGSPPPDHTFSQTLYVWMDVAGFSPTITFYLDALSMIFMLVITFVGFLIHLYSSEFMIDEEGYSRFFAYLNLFVGSMLVLVLADDLLFLYLGWEGVGLCSYLLIGFWYTDPENGYAARKAFVVTRVGDAALAVGLFLIFTQLGTLNIQQFQALAQQQWAVGSLLPVAAAALILGGAVGKSAQLPLQTWLPDAMAGPTPVSALIHAATMVTAGVYLIARTHFLFSLAPQVMLAVAIVGAATLLLSGFSGLTQRDIKRVLAYSTISQIGYMFLALGVGAWAAGVFHFMIHGFFKSLLFLGAGVIILGLHHEHDMFKMGGLRRQIPLTFWTFLIGSGALSAVPLITAGFYSKDKILFEAYASTQGSTWLWAAGLVGAFLTSMYTFRMVILTFFGPANAQITHRPRLPMGIPLAVLGFLSLAAGFLEIPSTLGNVPLFSDFLHSALPAPNLIPARAAHEGVFEAISGVVSLVGILVIYWFIVPLRGVTESWVKAAWGAALHRFWFVGWGFDWLYNRVFVWPYSWLARVNRQDIVDLLYTGLALLTESLHRVFSATQSGLVRRYAMGIAIGAIITVGLVVFL
jgi:NADH-quinone oxidoreductase subunit L